MFVVGFKKKSNEDSSSLKLEMQLYSPSLKVREDGRGGPIAVFSAHDQVGGKVSLDTSCYHSGRLTIALEGSFMYSVPTLSESSAGPRTQLQKHIFLAASNVISISGSEASSPIAVFQQAFVKRRPSISGGLSVTTSSSEKSHPFTFHLPQSVRPGEEMPASFTPVNDSLHDKYEICYKMIAEWEPSDVYETPSRLEVPIIIQPDAEFQCAEASATGSDSWLEMPLKSDRPIPVRCAITLPTSVTFSRSSSIPYFVVFTTTPRSPELAKEIAADATITVSLTRQTVINEQSSLPPTPPLTPSSEDSDAPMPKLLRRVARSQPRLRPRRTSEASVASATREKPLPQVPIIKTFSDTRTIHHNMCIGFPKRPRQQVDSNQKHPSLEAVAALPDGLMKTKIQLNRDMLPCIDWAGVSVKYYLDVSVLLGQDDLRARVPIQVT
ncbi:hypothetical protein BJ165DRAFT_1340545 [Panaeolus papilionaceus]|nr:hypothetical protein BJ165DRAFT_1340545 [Panaeolus papilionaceus]